MNWNWVAFVITIVIGVFVGKHIHYCKSYWAINWWNYCRIIVGDKITGIIYGGISEGIASPLSILLLL